MTLTPPSTNGIVIVSPRNKIFVKVEKTQKKRKEIRIKSSYSLKEKFNKSGDGKKVMNGRYIDFLEMVLKENGWDILYFVKKQKWSGCMKWSIQGL